MLWCQNTDTIPQIIFQQSNIRYFAPDPLQNLYTFSNDGIISKYDVNGQQQFTYENTTQGELTSIDASDPFNILLFFSEQQSLVLLDRTLSERSILDLRNSFVGQASAAVLSHDNKIWMYDDFENQLIKMDANANILLQSDNLRLTENMSQSATHIFIWKDKILVNFPDRGVAVFSLFAELEDWWPLKGITDGQVIDKNFAYRTEKGHFIYFPRLDIIERLNTIFCEDCTMIRTFLGRRYLLKKDGVLICYSD